jgi:bacterioferritin
MRGDQRVLDALNELLAEELAAINLYMVQAEMCENRGHDRLSQAFEARTSEEMKHVQRLVARILELEGRPAMGASGARPAIGETVEEQLRGTLQAEQSAAGASERALAAATAAADEATRELCAALLAEERAHVAWLDAELRELEASGLERYLAGG